MSAPVHALVDGGWPHVVINDGAGPELRPLPWRWHEVGQSKRGRALCKCGKMSPELRDTAARKRWFEQHKDEIRAVPVPGTQDTKEG